uniref:Large ribosomal subunit protein bL28m n=1 Tax=Ciona savignyi TaxID=51511 RepID=H2YLT0_CIOSA
MSRLPLPLHKIPLPVYKPGRSSWVHKRPRNDYLFNPAIKYPIYNRLPEKWRNSFEEKRSLLYQKLETGTKRPQASGLWRKKENGEPERVENIPLQVKYPSESRDGIWAGEGVVYGFKYARGKKMSRKFLKVWNPQLFTRSLYSEILDKKFTIAVTALTLDLIDEAYGFDHFILQTSDKILEGLGVRLKRKMLLKLADQENLFPENKVKKDQIIKKYKKYIIDKEEASWVGLTLTEAMEKQYNIEKKAGIFDPVPLLEVYTKQLKENVKISKENDQQSSSQQ